MLNVHTIGCDCSGCNLHLKPSRDSVTQILQKKTKKKNLVTVVTHQARTILRPTQLRADSKIPFFAFKHLIRTTGLIAWSDQVSKPLPSWAEKYFWPCGFCRLLNPFHLSKKKELGLLVEDKGSFQDLRQIIIPSWLLFVKIRWPKNTLIKVSINVHHME